MLLQEEKNLILITIQSEDASIMQSALACSKVLIFSQIVEPVLHRGKKSIYLLIPSLEKHSFSIYCVEVLVFVGSIRLCGP